MAILPADEDEDAPEGAGAGALGKKGKNAKGKHHENLLYIGIALVGVIITFLIYRSNKAAQASGTALTSSPPVSGQVVGSSGTSGTATDPYAEAGVNALTSQFQQQGQAISGLSSLLQTLQTEVGSMQASPPAAAPVAAATPATPGYGYINLPGIGQSVILGQVTDSSQDFTGYNVGGGAPVYFGNANGVAQGAAGETQGNYAYTPVAYASLVGSGVSSEHL